MSIHKLKDRRIGVLMGGLSPEREVSLQTGRTVHAALLRRGYNALTLDVGLDVCQRLRQAKVEVAFVALHGRFGEDGCIQGLLESMHIPYTGSGVLASAMAMDKVISKRLLQIAEVPVVPWRYPASEPVLRELGLPAVVKPRRQGSSVGVTIVRSPEEIARALEEAGDALAEQYIPGRELSVGVLGYGEEALCMGTVEIRPAGGMYDYQAKYEREDTQYLAPAPVPIPVLQRISALGLVSHRTLQCGGATRTDLRWDGQGEPLVLEVNTIPGMTGHSLLPMIAAQQGMSYDDLVERILEDAALEKGM